MKLTHNKISKSIFDSIIDFLPNIQISRHKDFINPVAATNLYRIWKNSPNKMGKKIYERPATMGSNDLEDMKKSGLVKVVGNNIEITSKGENVIRVMILGDDRSSYEEDGIIMDYNTSLKNIKSVKTAKKRNNSWWDSFPK